MVITHGKVTYFASQNKIYAIKRNQAIKITEIPERQKYNSFDNDNLIIDNNDTLFISRTLDRNQTKFFDSDLGINKETALYSLDNEKNKLIKIKQLKISYPSLSVHNNSAIIANNSGKEIVLINLKSNKKTTYKVSGYPKWISWIDSETAVFLMQLEDTKPLKIDPYMNNNFYIINFKTAQVRLVKDNPYAADIYPLFFSNETKIIGFQEFKTNKPNMFLFDIKNNKLIKLRYSVDKEYLYIDESSIYFFNPKTQTYYKQTYGNIREIL